MKKYKKYPTYKDSEAGWIESVPCDWKMIKLKHTIENKKSGDWGAAQSFDINDIICIRVADFDYENGAILPREDYTIRNVDKSKRNELIKNESLLIEKSGGGEQTLVGRVVLFNLDIKAVCTNFIEKFECKKDFCPQYLNYLFKALYGVGVNYRSIKQTTGIQNLDIKRYFDEFVIAPCLETQNKIADTLDKETARIKKIIEKKKHFIELLKEKQAAVIMHAVTKGLNPKAKMKPSMVEWIGGIPEEWELKKLRFCAKINPQSDRNVLSGLKDTDEVSFVPMEDVPANEMQLVAKKTEPIEKVKKGYTFFVEGDVLLAKITPCYENGKGAVVEKLVNNVAYGTTELHVIKTGAGLSKRFLYYFTKLKGFRELGEASMKGAAGQKRVPELYLKDCLIPIPTYKTQENISNYLDKEVARIDQVVEKAEKWIELMQEYKQSLITAVVTGKIDVREAV